MWTRYWQVRVRNSPTGTVLTELDIDQQVRVTGGTIASDGKRWLRVRLWGALNGWIRADLLAPAPFEEPLQAGVPVAPNPVGSHAPMPLHADALADGRPRIHALPVRSSRVVGTVSAGARLTVTRWATDATGQAWYEITAPARGWVGADGVNLLPTAGGATLDSLHGLGMWLTPPVLDTAPPEALVTAARLNHVTHLYVEVGGSHMGFWGADELRKLLPVAHAAHIAVIAWVYPFLDDVPHDVAMTLQAMRYTSPTGDRPDGLMADVEQNMQEPYVRAYSQVLRATLGAKVLMGITTYPPQSYWGKIYPFRTVARSWDVIVPQDYWRITRRTYTAADAYRYVMDSLSGIRAASGRPTVPIEVLGQTFDLFGNGREQPHGAGDPGGGEGGPRWGRHVDQLLRVEPYHSGGVGRAGAAAVLIGPIRKPGGLICVYSAWQHPSLPAEAGAARSILCPAHTRSHGHTIRACRCSKGFGCSIASGRYQRPAPPQRRQVEEHATGRYLSVQRGRLVCHRVGVGKRQGVRRGSPGLRASTYVGKASSSSAYSTACRGAISRPSSQAAVQSGSPSCARTAASHCRK
jgi:hypothetical protein